MARLEGLEPPTKGLENPCSIQLSYRRDIGVADNFARISNQGAPATTRRSTPEGLRQETPRLNTKAGSCTAGLFVNPPHGRVIPGL